MAQKSERKESEHVVVIILSDVSTTSDLRDDMIGHAFITERLDYYMTRKRKKVLRIGRVITLNGEINQIKCKDRRKRLEDGS